MFSIILSWEGAIGRDSVSNTTDSHYNYRDLVFFLEYSFFLMHALRTIFRDFKWLLSGIHLY